MNLMALGIPLIPAAVQGASRVAAGGLGLLQSLAAPPAPNVAPTEAAATSPGATTDIGLTLDQLRQRMGEEISRAGFGEALPLQIADDGQGRMRVVSDHPQREAIEQLLNNRPALADAFRQLASRAAESLAGSPLRFAVYPSSGFDRAA
jgi:hypothetical protein